MKGEGVKLIPQKKLPSKSPALLGLSILAFLSKSYHILTNLNNIFIIHWRTREVGVMVQNEPKVSLF